MTTARDHLSKADTVTIAAIEAGVPMLAEARDLIDRFQAMIRRRSSPISIHGSPRPAPASSPRSPTASPRIKRAVRAAITEPWSNGQTEGQITKLKLVKRQMYGRGKLDLLQARLIGAA